MSPLRRTWRRKAEIVQPAATRPVRASCFMRRIKQVTQIPIFWSREHLRASDPRRSRPVSLACRSSRTTTIASWVPLTTIVFNLIRLFPSFYKSFHTFPPLDETKDDFTAVSPLVLYLVKSARNIRAIRRRRILAYPMIKLH